MSIPEPVIVDPLATDLPQQFSALGRTPGIYSFASADRVTHLSWSTNLPRRLRRLLCDSSGQPTMLANRLHGSATTVRYWPTASKLESSLLLYQLAKIHFADDYMTRLRLRMPWFVALVDTDRFARLTVTNRLIKKAESAIGPFPNREAAQRYQEELLGLFQLRRCWEELNPAPEHPGCIYGEMNLCLRPCQCAVNEKAYRHEADAVKDLLYANGRSTLHQLSLARDKAAAETDFEAAAQFHKRIEKLKTANKSRDEAITDVQEFNGIAITRGLRENQFRLWPVLASCWQEPVLLEITGNDPTALSLDNRLRDLLTPVFLHPTREGHQGENLAVFARWYYSSWRDGEWIALSRLDGSGYRRLVRGISRLAKEGLKKGSALSC